MSPTQIVRPRTTEEVAAVITLCAADGVSVCVCRVATRASSAVRSHPRPATHRRSSPSCSVPPVHRSVGDVDATGRCVGAQAGATVAAISGTPPRMACASVSTWPRASRRPPAGWWPPTRAVSG